MIISHRGRGNHRYENSIEAFKLAIKQGAEAIECDLRLTLDKKVVVNHNRYIFLNGKKFIISKTPLKLLGDILTIDRLFGYIKKTKVPFFLELKSSSSILISEVIGKIKKDNLWSRVYIIGFSIFIGKALKAQKDYSNLRVVQIILNPLYSYIKPSKKSYGVFMGWIDGWKGTQWLFRKTISSNRLIKLRKRYEKNGFRVMAGVINNTSGFKFFRDAGILDIVTDNIYDAEEILKR